MYISIKVAYFNTKDIARGFQIQPEVDSIFGFLLKSLEKSKFLDEENKHLAYAGRTDYGVNAISQVISFHLNKAFNEIPERFLHRINSRLPINIRCWAYSIVPNEFHPRFQALERHYWYIYTTQVNENLDLTKMIQAGDLLQGTHNFVNFAKRDTELDNFTRTLNKITIEKINDVFLFKLYAKSFLWQQCRRITAHLIQIGNGSLDISETYKLLNEINGITKPTPLPPENLILTDIIYENIRFTEDRTVKLKIYQMIDEELHSIKKKENSLIYFKKLFNKINF